VRRRVEPAFQPPLVSDAQTPFHEHFAEAAAPVGGVCEGYVEDWR
jgi:hypothetical protein